MRKEWLEVFVFGLAKAVQTSIPEMITPSCRGLRSTDRMWTKGKKNALFALCVSTRVRLLALRDVHDLSLMWALKALSIEGDQVSNC